MSRTTPALAVLLDLRRSPARTLRFVLPPPPRFLFLFSVSFALAGVRPTGLPGGRPRPRGLLPGGRPGGRPVGGRPGGRPAGLALPSAGLAFAPAPGGRPGPRFPFFSFFFASFAIFSLSAFCFTPDPGGRPGPRFTGTSMAFFRGFSSLAFNILPSSFFADFFSGSASRKGFCFGVFLLFFSETLLSLQGRPTFAGARPRGRFGGGSVSES